MQRLKFRIPPFTNLAWVSDDAAQRWEPRFRRLNVAMIYSTLRGIHEGRWEVRRIRVPGALALRLVSEARDFDVEVTELPVGRPKERGPAFTDFILRKNGTDPEADGIPASCRARHAATVAADLRETIWEAALATPGAKHKPDRNLIRVPEGTVFGPLWQKVLVNPVSYSLEQLHCPDSQQIVREQIVWMAEMGYQRESIFLNEISNWPVEWSAGHGICELRTPVLKIACETDATDQTYRIEIKGSTYPELGVSGLNFPYRQRKFLRITDSKSFKEGLKHGC